LCRIEVKAVAGLLLQLYKKRINRHIFKVAAHQRAGGLLAICPKATSQRKYYEKVNKSLHCSGIKQALPAG
jgi:hypothetical protein